jgi:hypothetical protein
MKERILMLLLAVVQVYTLSAQTGREQQFQTWALTPPMGCRG